MKKYIVMYGLGGCWSGHTHANILEAKSEKEAYDKTYDLVYKTWHENRIEHEGASTLVVEYECSNISEESILSACGGRLKESGVEMLLDNPDKLKPESETQLIERRRRNIEARNQQTTTAGCH